MVPTETDFACAMERPRDVVQEIYDTVRGVETHFRELFRDPERRMRFGCELFLGTLRANDTSVCGLYGAETRFDTVQETDASPHNMAERLVVCGVSIPGESPWVHQLLAGSEDVTAALARLALYGPNRAKRTASERSPIAEQPSITALVKLADVDRAEQLHTTELIEVIGLLDTSFLPNPELPIEGTAEDTLPQLPCIHALCFDRVQEDAVLLPMLHTASLTAPPAFASLDETRSAVVGYLAQSLGGDVLAAEFVLLALLAKMYVLCSPSQVRRPGLAVGSLSLNLSHVESTATHLGLFDAIASLVSAAVMERMTLANLNDTSRSFYVRSTDAGMSAGRLQLPRNTCVVVDEVCLGEGKLQDAGVRNVRALANVLQNHTLTYQFPFSELELDTDLNVVVVSTGKSLLPVDVQVPLQSEHVCLGDTCVPAPAAALTAFRAYVLEARQAQATVPESMSIPIHNYFVERRQSGPRYAYTELDLQRCLNLARIVAVSFGQRELTPAAWAHAVQLDEQRMQRLAP
ncbi:hypothetical protein CBS14141_003986 [Malassezia furfur]|nr:hypothetical protein CBS14141_003986 [Malassezia furfur]